ncbi:hypothetical protein AncyloWKF20_07630 [Ancylobacter sp. WKF20]|uniref:hypothetical protein n=1 Tax=Ancylobacter sp. WKF20 TaxID=3039801 RepID=UPI0024346354|nr:hypothetical protein [Ancylobacter sp. WKF20]WGD31680.1 hypothetical protein AncyloWKF20_07630 [Ancylobacter sp. WKF20]
MTTTKNFKVGDKVRFLDTLPAHWWFKQGQTGVIASVRAGGTLPFIVEVDPEFHVSGHGRAFVGPKHIELTSSSAQIEQGSVVRFKDTVEDQAARRRCFPDSTKGSTFTVTRAGPTFVYFGGSLSGFYRTRFELVQAPAPVAAAPSRSHIVVLKDASGQLKPASKPFIHETSEAAEREAARLAEANPGNTFVVFSSSLEAAAPKPSVSITKHAA